MKLLPINIDNSFQGNKIALWFFYPITLITIARSLVHMLAPDGGAQSIATIPLSTYPYDASKTIVLMFALWGLAQFIMGIFYLAVAVKYKSLIPLMYVFICIEYTGRLLLGHIKPMVTGGTPPGEIGNYVMVPLSILLFALSVMQRNKA